MTGAVRVQGVRFQLATLALWALGFGALLLATLAQSGGTLVYTLDDPYIHLALAEQILHGGYGINPGEFASPSSSILYPLLLVPLLALGLGTWAPLILSALAQGALVWLLAGLLAPLVRGVLGLVAGAALILAVNGFALPLTGMEHPLHALASVAVVIGLARAAKRAPPRWLVAALVLAVAVRFEGLALALAALILLAVLGQGRRALTGALALATLLAAYGAAMVAMGLPLLPSSVMVKSLASAAAVEADWRDTLVQLVANVIRALGQRWGLIHAAAALGFGALALWGARSVRPVAALGLAVLAAHLLVGRYGWFGRYEVYATAVMLAVALRALRRATPRPWHPAALTLALALLGAPYLATIAQTPGAARAVWQQHAQMHRFSAQFYPRPVAVNDLGYVAWDNPANVLDLWGLGSETARRVIQQQGRSVETLRALTGDRAAYAMIYDVAFAGAVPPEWCRVARLHTSRGVAASDEVSFYLIDRGDEAAIRGALAAFAPGLPPGATLSENDCPPT